MSRKSKKPKDANPPNPSEQRQPETWNAATVAALIAAIATVLVALFQFPPFIKLFQEDPTPTPTVTLTISPTVSTDTPFPLVDLPLVTDTPSPTAIITSTATATPTATETSIPSTTFTESPLLSGKMNVQLNVHVDKSTWKAPLTVGLDARDSFLRESDGKIYPCKGGPCSYTWQVYKGSQKIGKPTKNSIGTFEYTFGKKGTYLITVSVCRGHESSDCGSSNTTVEVK